MNYSDEEKIKRLLDAQEHPEHYTDEELCEIIHDARLPVACHPWSLTPPPSPPIIVFPAGCVWQLSSSAVSSLPV